MNIRSSFDRIIKFSLKKVSRFEFVETYLKSICRYFFPIKTRTFKNVSVNDIGYLDYKIKLIKIYIDSNKVLYRLNSCKKEPKTVKWIEDFIKENDVFYDIGANIGAYSFVAYINTSGKCKIYSFEPGFSTYNNLCHNIYLNNFQDKIIPLNIALSDKSGIDEFRYSSLFSGFAEHPGINKDNNTSQFKKRFVFSQKIFKYSLDDVVAKMNLDLPNHLKIDVDGHEFYVLSGAEETLSNKSLKTIQVEININSADTIRICNLLEKHNFKIIQKNQHWEGPIYDYIFKK